MRTALSFPTAPRLEKGFEPLDNPVAIALVAICLVIIFIGLFAVVSSTKGLRNPDNPSRELIVDFFRSQGAVSELGAISREQFPFWLRQSSNESNVFQAMQRKGVIKKTGKKYYLDENALSELLSK